MYKATLVAIAMLTSVATGVQAQSLSDNPIRVIVPFPAGGGTDLMARAVMDKVASSLGTVAVVDNRPGAGGMVGTTAVARAAPDGYTIGLTTAAHAINPWLEGDMQYDTFKDLTAITFVARASGAIVINPSVPANTLLELIELIKKEPNKYTYASAGIGTPPHLSGELFKLKTGVNIRHIPYKGNGPAFVDLMSGQVSMMLPTLSTVLPLIQDGRLKALAVMGDKRSAFLPDVPTFAEAGVQDFDLNSQWYLLFVPSATPKEIVDLIHREAVKAIASPDVEKTLKDTGFEVIANSPEEAAVMLKAEYEAWGELVKAAGVGKK